MQTLGAVKRFHTAAMPRTYNNKQSQQSRLKNVRCFKSSGSEQLSRAVPLARDTSGDPTFCLRRTTSVCKHDNILMHVFMTTNFKRIELCEPISSFLYFRSKR